MLIFLLVILLLAALLEYLSLRRGPSCVDADFSLDRMRTEPNAPITLTADVRNVSRLPITWLKLEIGFPLSAKLPEDAEVRRDLSHAALSDVYRLWGRQRVERRIAFSMEKRGVYTVSGREISRGDFLALQTRSARFDRRRSIVVYPPLLRDGTLTESLGRDVGELSAQRWLLRDPILTLGVREYTGSEPMHTISWNQTARRGELTVREFDYTRSLDCCVLFCVNGLTREDAELLDLSCSAARTICDTLCRNGVDARLFTNSALAGYPDAACRSATASPGRQEDVLDILARVTGVSCAAAVVFAEATLWEQPDAAAYLFLVPRRTEETESALEQLTRRTGVAPILICAEELEEVAYD